MASSSFEQALGTRLRHDPGRPLVTFYDDATGERTELSATTYANWVAKTAGVLAEDVDLPDGSAVLLDLPPHWLGPVFLGACWLAGVGVVGPGGSGADLHVLGPAGLASDRPAGVERLLCALDPFAGPSRQPLPAGMLDFGTLWPGQPDAYLGLRARPGTPAYAGEDWSRLVERSPATDDRVLTDLNPVSPEGVALLIGALTGAGSVVWVANPDPAQWAHRAETEQTTREVRAAR